MSWYNIFLKNVVVNQFRNKLCKYENVQKKFASILHLSDFQSGHIKEKLIVYEKIFLFERSKQLKYTYIMAYFCHLLTSYEAY